MKTRLLSALFIFTGAIAAMAQTPDKAKLDEYFKTLETNNKFMGNVMVSKNGQAVYSKSIGYADAASGTKTTIDSRFRIGSISKMFTSALVFKAVEENKILLTDKLDKYFPQVPNAAKITVPNLLNHHSGINNFTNDAAYLTYNTMPKTQAEMIDLIVKGGSDFEPGSKGEYSNSNYVLLTYILEKAYNKPYKELLEQKIIRPLGLKNTYYGGKTNTAANEVYSYKFNGKWEKETETDMSIPAGAGAIVSNVSDLSRFIENLFAGKIISAANLEQMKTITDGYGMGMFVIPFGAKKGYGHSGGIDGYVSLLAYYPEDKVTLAYTMNGLNYDDNNVAIAALSWIFNEPIDIPVFYNHKPEELALYTGDYTSAQIPLPIKIFVENNILMGQGQAPGQQAFPLEGTANGKFECAQIGVEIEFAPEQKEMVLKQGGAEYRFKKDK